jgi:ADP-ribose pyrophosphatase YjhB (NUDIX family)
MSDWRLRLEPVITPVFRTWWRLRRPMTLGVRIIACDEKQRVLLIRHTYADGWHLPGGGVDHGETALQAALRELAEEGGVESTEAQIVGFYSNHTRFRNDHIVLYRTERWRPCATRENGEIAERGFFALDALPAGVTPGTQRRLAEAFSGAPPSAAW